MKHSIKINFFNGTIEATTSFVKKASVFYSSEYNMLMDAQRQHPTFYLKIIPSKKKTAPVITYEFMREYIITHGACEENLQELDRLIIMQVPYFTIKKWFMEQYPVFKDCKSKEEWLLVA
jgi:hypothetical protein